MSPARTPRDREDVRLLVIEPDGALRDRSLDALPSLLRRGDLVVVNDAATLPGSLRGTLDGAGIELRLAAIQLDGSWQAVLFGAGDWRTPTEHRPPPPAALPGAILDLGRTRTGARLVARVLAVSAVSPRLVTVALSIDGARHARDPQLVGAVWAAIYELGRPVQYAYLSEPLQLWSVQTVFAARPWAVELPSAGRPLSWQLLRRLDDAGIDIATLTHAAGLSSTGDPALDRALPLPERYEIPNTTLWRIAEAKRRGRAVIAVGTTVVRALEASAAASGSPLPRIRQGMAELRIDPSTRLSVVDGLLTGMHAPGESHFDLMGAFTSDDALARAGRHAEQAGYLGHEFGDLTLVLPRRAEPRVSLPRPAAREALSAS